MDMNTIVIAMDGPSGAGKSSTARGVASRLGLRYLDTGAQFRAVAVWVARHGINPEDPAAVAQAVNRIVIRSGTDPEDPQIFIGEEEVSEQIRDEETTSVVSRIAANPQVRAALLQLQRDIIGPGGIVVEGRDIGTVVAPEAALKLYLSADPHIRAARRALENNNTDIAATQSALEQRDRLDSQRETAPLQVPDGAIHIDTTHRTLQEVIEHVVELATSSSE